MSPLHSYLIKLTFVPELVKASGCPVSAHLCWTQCREPRTHYTGLYRLCLPANWGGCGEALDTLCGQP